MAAPVATMDETSQKTIADLTAKVDAQDKSNQQLQQNMVTLQEQMKQQTAMMQEQLKQQNALIQTLQANNTKQISQDAVANQVEEKLDSENESSKKKSLKHKQAA